jgi:hypothetical protein
LSSVRLTKLERRIIVRFIAFVARETFSPTNFTRLTYEQVDSREQHLKIILATLFDSRLTRGELTRKDMRDIRRQMRIFWQRESRKYNRERSRGKGV